MAESGALMIRSDVLPDGAYAAVLEVGDDEMYLLDPERYGRTVLAAVERAAYDAAVIRQLTAKGIEPESAAQMVSDLRADRPPLDDLATAPLRFVAGVAQRDGRGFITIVRDGNPVGQLELPEARLHAVAALQVGIIADLDGAYHRALRGVIGLGDDVARAVVGELADHRDEPAP